MVLVHNWPFFQPIFLGNIVQDNVFYDILEQKKNFNSRLQKQQVQKVQKLTFFQDKSKANLMSDLSTQQMSQM